MLLIKMTPSPEHVLFSLAGLGQLVLDTILTEVKSAFAFLITLSHSWQYVT